MSAAAGLLRACTGPPPQSEGRTGTVMVKEQSAEEPARLRSAPSSHAQQILRTAVDA